MPALGGAYSGFIKDDLANAQQAASAQAVIQRMLIEGAQARAASQAAERALAAQRNQGAIFGAMYPNAGMTPPGLPPPPAGTPAGGPIPPGVGVPSQPAAPPQQAAPAGAIPMPPPSPQGSAGPMPQPSMAPPAAPIPPFRPIPSQPPPQMAGPAAIPAPPAPTAAAAPSGPAAGAPPPSFMERFVGAMRQAGVPPEQWGDQLQTLPPIVKESVAQEIQQRDKAQKALLDQANLILKEREVERKREQGERRLDQGEEALKLKKDRIAKIGSTAASGKLLSDDDARFMAEQALAGDRTVMQNLGRGAQGAENVVKVRRAIRELAQSRGLGGEDVAGATASFEGDKAAQRAAGTQGARLSIVAHEMDKFVPLAEAAADKVPRTGFVPLNRLIQLGEAQWSPEQAAFVAANRSLITTFAQLTNRGAPTVHSTQEAEKMLSTAATPEQYKAVTAQLKLEAKAAIDAVKDVRNDLRNRAPGKSPTGGERAPQAALDYLKAHPESAPQFSAKYGYLPAGAR